MEKLFYKLNLVWILLFAQMFVTRKLVKRQEIVLYKLNVDLAAISSLTERKGRMSFNFRLDDSIDLYNTAFKKLRGNRQVDYKPLGLNYQLQASEVRNSVISTFLFRFFGLVCFCNFQLYFLKFDDYDFDQTVQSATAIIWQIWQELEDWNLKWIILLSSFEKIGK